MTTPNNTPIDPNASYLAAVKDFVDKNSSTYSWQDYIDRVNQSPELVQALNSYANAEKVIGVDSTSTTLNYFATTRELTLNPTALLSPTWLTRALAHEIYGHDQTRDFISAVLDPSNPLYQDKTPAEVSALVQTGCFAAETLGAIGEYRVGLEAGFSPTGYPGLDADIRTAIDSVKQFLPSNTDTRTIDLAAAQFIATKVQANDAGHAQQCANWAQLVVNALPSAASTAQMVFSNDWSSGASSIAAISADGKSVTTSADNNGDGRIDNTSTSTYTDQTRSTLSSEISDRFNYSAGTVTTSIINYNPGGNMCTFDTKVSTILGGSWLGGVTGTESVSELGRSIVTADISGVGISIDANSANISLASGASAIVNGDGNTISLASAATLTINGTAEVKTSKGVYSVSGQSVVSESANGQVDVINGGLADISVLEAANASADPIGTLANALAGQEATQTIAGVDKQPNGDQTFTADDGSTLTMHTDPVTGVTTVSSTPAPNSNLLGSGLGGNPAFTSATSSTASVSSNGSSSVRYNYPNGTNMTASTPPAGTTTYTSDTTVGGYPAVVGVVTDGSGKPITSGDGSPITGALISGGPPPPPPPPPSDITPGGSSNTTPGGPGSPITSGDGSTVTSGDGSAVTSGNYGGGDSPPVLIDMDGDGVEIIARNASNVYFDSLGGGLLHHTGWVGGDDAMVVEDLNGDAKITLGSEISFAQRTAADDSDLQALISLHDTNGDGQISAADTGFANLRLWKDANSNGITDAGELLTFADAGLVSISGQRRIVNYNTGDATISAMSTATFETNGQTTTHAVADASFQVEAAVFQSVSTDVNGNLIATTVDGRRLLQANTALNTTLSTGLDGALGSALADTITATKAAWIVGGAGNDVIYGSAQDDWLQGGAGSDLLVGGDGNDTLVMDAQDNTWLIQGGKGFDTIIVEGAGGVSLDMALSTVEAAYGGNGNDVFTNSGVGSVLMSGGGGDDALTGGTAADVLQGGLGNDTLEGGAGNDVLMGGAGNDTYILRAGTGKDTLLDNAGTDRILVRGNYSASDIVLTRRDRDVIVTLKGTSDSMVLTNWFSNVANQTSAGEIESIQFENGSAAIDSQYIHSLLDNHAPTPMADTAQTQEDATVSASGNVLTNDTDQDINLQWDSRQHLTISNPGTYAGTYGELQLNADGSYSYAVKTSLEAVQALGRNSVLTETFSYTVQDNAVDSKTASSNLTITITGTNDSPQAVADVAAVSEDNVLNASGNALSNDTDVDSGDVLSVVNAGVFQGTYGDLTLQADGSYRYDLNNTAANVQNLRGGQQMSDSFAYTATDGLATSNATVSVTITGTNDAPVAFADSAATTENSTVLTTGNVLANDIDPDQATVLSVTNAGVFAGTYGTLTLAADGSYHYALNNSAANVQALGRDAVVTDTFAYTVNDDGSTPLSANANLTITITGTNDSPQAVADVAAVSEDNVLNASGNVLANDNDVDVGDVLSVTTPGVFHGTYGDLTLSANGAYSYSLNNTAINVQNLRGGQQVSDSFDYTATDGLANANSALTISVTGKNDAPVAYADVAAVKEDTVTGATGNVLANDTDPDQGTILSVTNAGVYAGQYGTLTLSVNGSYSYALNNSAANVQALADGQVVTDQFSYAIQDDDAQPLTAASTLTLTITGTNDAPTVAAALVTQAARERQVFSYTVPVGTFADVDNGDALTYSAVALNTAGGTQALPSWLRFNATTRTFSGTPGSADGGSFDFQVTATDKLGASVSTRFTLDIADEYAGTGANINVITGNWTNDTLNGTSRSETIYGGGGTDRIFAGEGNNTVVSCGRDTYVTAGAGNDTITTSYGTDTIYAGDGTNKVNAGGGNNLVVTGSGDDTISTDWGFSNINAGAGNNTIMATGDATVVSTGAGNDNITTNYGNDTINAGDGNNTISAGGGNNRIAAGSGNDLITTGWGNSTIDAGDGANVITATGGNTVVTTGAGADRINTGSGNDTINSGAGNDVISASWGLDVINAGAGDDTITTGGGNDIVRAGLGNDTIIADQWSDDKYYYTRGDGRDTLTDGGGMDTLVLENIRSDQLWFTHVGNDLNVSVVGSSDGVTIKNWYTGLQYPGAQRHVEQFQTSDGKVLLDCQVQNLVNAMAAFAPPVAGQTNLTGSAAATLAPVLAANWQ